MSSTADAPSSVVLYEHQESEHPVELRIAERDALRQLVRPMTFAPVAGSESQFVLNPRNAVGAIQLGDRRFELRPKIAVRRLAFLIAYSLDPKHWRDSEFDFREDRDIFEAVVPGFALHVERAMRQGPLLGYRPEEASLQTVRGRIRFDDQLRNRFGLIPPIDCRFDEFTEDIEINRLLKAATERLSRIRIRSPHTRTRLRTIRSYFGGVSSVLYDPRAVPEIAWTRLNTRFKPATELARLFLRGHSFELTGGAVAGASFVLDMSTVFEDFVVTALREALGLSEREFPQQARGRMLYLDRAGALRLRPDLSWWTGDLCRFIGDVKYKKTPESAGVLHPDVYQLLAYTTATGLRKGLLIYAHGAETDQTYRIAQTATEIEVVTLDLDVDPEGVLEQIREIARRVRQQAALATPPRLVPLAA